MLLEVCLACFEVLFNGARFLTVGGSEGDIARHRSEAVLFMLYKIRFNPMQTLYGALPELYVPLIHTLNYSAV